MQLKWLSSQKLLRCPFGHRGKSCLEIKDSPSNPLFAGLMEIRKETMESPTMSDQSSLSPTDGANLNKMKIARADSGGTIQHLLTSGHRRGRTSGKGFDRAFGHKVTDTHFHELAESLQQWRRKEFQPESAPEMPTIKGAKAKVQAARSSGLVDRTSGGSSTTTTTEGGAMMDKYRRKGKRARNKYKKHKQRENQVQFKGTDDAEPGAPSVRAQDLDDEQRDTVSPLKPMGSSHSPGGGKRTSYNAVTLDLRAADSGGRSGGISPKDSNYASLRRSKGSVFMDSTGMGGVPGIQSRNSGPLYGGRAGFNRHRKGSNSGAPGSPRNGYDRRRRSTIEHNVHIETFQLTAVQKEKMENPDFIRKLRNDFTNFGSFNYDARHDTLGIVLMAQRLRKAAFIFLENRLGALDSGHHRDEKEDADGGHGDAGDAADGGGGGGKNKGRRRSSAKGDQCRFLVTDMQHEVLSSPQFMQQLFQDFEHFGTLNVHEDELVLESFKRSRTIAACQKLERRLGALWTRNEVQQCMADMGRSSDDIESQLEMVKFLNSMVQSVSSGGRFRKHRKHGKAAHRWVLIDKDRLYWKENAAAQNQKTRSFNLAKIVAIQPGKHTSALKNAHDVDEACCFSIVSKKHVTLDLSGESEDEVQSWITFLTAYNRHFKQQLQAANIEKTNHPSTRKLVEESPSHSELPRMD